MFRSTLRPGARRPKHLHPRARATVGSPCQATGSNPAACPNSRAAYVRQR
ncbi:hypothetical protein [Ornithinimicrobium kibberense]